MHRSGWLNTLVSLNMRERQATDVVSCSSFLLFVLWQILEHELDSSAKQERSTLIPDHIQTLWSASRKKREVLSSPYLGQDRLHCGRGGKITAGSIMFSLRTVWMIRLHCRAGNKPCDEIWYAGLMNIYRTSLRNKIALQAKNSTTRKRLWVIRVDKCGTVTNYTWLFMNLLQITPNKKWLLQIPADTEEN